MRTCNGVQAGLKGESSHDLDKGAGVGLLMLAAHVSLYATGFAAFNAGLRRHRRAHARNADRLTQPPRHRQAASAAPRQTRLDALHSLTKCVTGRC